MKKIITIIILLCFSTIIKAQTLVVNPQNNANEGGEIALLQSNDSFNDWRIDNYRGFLRFHHSGKSYFDLSNNGNMFINGTAILKATSNIEGGEIRLLGSTSYNHWNIDNYKGYLRFHHSGKSYFDLSKDGNMFINGTAILKATSNIEGGEIQLLGSTSYNHWHIDNYQGYLRFHHSGKSYLNINKNGNLSLDGKIETKEVVVTNTPTADFVFEELYDLPTLDFLENYVKTNKHLPEIASAKTMKQNGVNIGNFQIQLLQKIEELTLYTIQQEKQLATVQATLKSVQEELKKLKKK